MDIFSPMDAAKGKRKQKNISLGPAKAPFETWCASNNYNVRGVVLAGWLSLTKLTHAERKRFFEEVKDWEKQGFPIDERDGPLGLRPGEQEGASAPPMTRRRQKTGS